MQFIGSVCAGLFPHVGSDKDSLMAAVRPMLVYPPRGERQGCAEHSARAYLCIFPAQGATTDWHRLLEFADTVFPPRGERQLTLKVQPLIVGSIPLRGEREETG